MDLPKEIKFQTQEEADAFLATLQVASVTGLDEVGRGPFAGDVVTACVTLPPNHGIVGINDSKKLSISRREELAAQILSCSNWAVGYRTPPEIDFSNIREATFDAAVDAAMEVNGKEPIHLLLCDGGLPIGHRLPFDTVSVVKGDLWYECIGAASIVAKVYRDAQMAAYHSVWPEYGFNTNQGYGTKFHIEAIKKYGLTPIHRKSFGICKTTPERDYGHR